MELIRQKIEWAKIPIRVNMGNTQISVQDLLYLECGDVIPLDKGINDTLHVYIGEHIKFKGIPGLSGNRMAVQITEVVTKGGDSDE